MLVAIPLLALALPATADEVTPSERVKSRLNVRAKAPKGRVIASLARGDRRELVATVDGWHEIRLDDGKSGFVSAGWTTVIPAPEPVVVIPAEPVPLAQVLKKPGFGARVGAWFRRLFGGEPNVDVFVTEPSVDGMVYRHLDPNLPVSGFATLRDAGRDFDVILVLDRSSSTNEHAETDVDGDGVLGEDWRGGDTVFKAELAAAMSFVKTLATLPHNSQGQRIRVGIITTAGDDDRRLAPEDEDLDISLETLRWLGHRDARVDVPLTRDYELAQRTIEKLWLELPLGMTNIAAGVGRAVIELSGDTLRGAQSEARPGAERVILLLTDGKPRLPYDRDTARRAASYAGKLASDYGIRVNAFELRENPVTLKRALLLRRMARRSGGRYVALDRPGDVVRALSTTSFAKLERLRVRNDTTGHESPDIAMAIDGSFYAEVPLRVGANDLEVEARLDNGDKNSERFQVVYQQGVPTAELEKQLVALQQENAALIDHVRRRLVVEAEAQARVRLAQERKLELSVEQPPAVSAGSPTKN